MSYSKLPRLLGNVKRILTIPCAIPWQVYAETAVPAALGMGYDVLSPDPKELYHRIAGHSALCEFKSVLKDVSWIPPESESKATRFFFQSLETFDKASWYLFLGDVAAEGLLNWTTQIIHQAACAANEKPGFAYGPFWFGAIHADGTWGGLDFQYLRADGSIDYAPAEVGCRAGGTCSITASAVFNLWIGPQVATSSRVIDVGSGSVLDHDTNGGVDEPPSRSNHVWAKARAGSDTRTLAVNWSGNYPGAYSNQLFPNNDAHSTRYTSDF